MDRSGLRRGRPTVHVQLASWHRGQGMSGSADRFGESGAVLLGDLCLVWAEQAMRESGLPHTVLDRGWPRYDAMRSELAVGQFADLLNEARRVPTLDEVMDVLRRKSATTPCGARWSSVRPWPGPGRTCCACSATTAR